MSQKATFTESVKVNLDPETYQEIRKRAQNKGLPESAVCRSILKQKVNA